MTFSLVIPCYNEAGSLPELVRRAADCARARALGPGDFRLVLVDNGSTDGSDAVLRDLAAGPDGAFLDVVRVSPNRGYGDGILRGLRAAAPRGGILAWTHADGQCDPGDAFRGFEIVRDAPVPTLVKGRRHGRAAADRLVSRAFEALALLVLGRRLHEINAQPKVFPAGLVARLDGAPPDFPFDLFVLLRARDAGLALREIDVAFPPRRHGQSRWAATARSRARTMLRFAGYMVRYRLGIAPGER